MINISGNYWVPSDRFKYISNEREWSEGIYLGRSDNISNWHDTNDEPPEPEEHEEAMPEDYADALADLGVRL